MHFMIDLETMGIRANAAIVSIGAVAFDETQIYSSYYTPVSLQSCLSLGLTTDESTVKWWDSQPDEIKAAWNVASAPHLSGALKDFQEWMVKGAGNRRNAKVWGNGVDFDMVVLKSAFNALGADEPWMYYNQRDFRTLKSMFEVTVPAKTAAHNALADAKHQAEHLQIILREHKISLS